MEDVINSEDFCFIEWPEKIMVVLPLQIVNVFIDITDNTNRRIIAKFT